MFEKGFSQLPVRNRSTNSFAGVVTEISVLKRMMMPGEHSTGGLRELSGSRIDEAGVIEGITSVPQNTSLVEITEILLRDPAVLLTKLGEIKGIHTRADFLKYLFEE
jgi:predicted transcriptional regulator